MVATHRGHYDAVRDPVHRAKLWDPPQQEPQQVEALLTWVENLWRELKVTDEDRRLFLTAHDLPQRTLVERLQRTVRAEMVADAPKRSPATVRPKSAPFPDPRRRKHELDKRCEPLAAHARLLLRFRRATLRSLREIEAREKLVKRVKACFNLYRDGPAPKKKKRTIYDDDVLPLSEPALKEALSDLKATLRPLNEATARVVAAVAAWRCYQWRPEPFLWKGRDYLEKCTTDLHFLGDAACPEGVAKPDRRLAAALGPWMSHPATNCVWWHARQKSKSARDAQQDGELRGRDALRRWIRHTMDVATASHAGDRTAAADAAARAVMKLYAPIDEDTIKDLSSARSLLLDEPYLRNGVAKERVRMARAHVPLPTLRWLPPASDAPCILAAAAVFHGAKSYAQLQDAELSLNVRADGEATRRLKACASSNGKPRRRRRRKRRSLEAAPAPAPIKSVTFQTAQHAAVACNIFANKDNLGLRKLQLGFRLRRDRQITAVAAAKKAAHELKRKHLVRGGAPVLCLEREDGSDEFMRRQIASIDLRLDEPAKYFDLQALPARGDRESRGCDLRERLPPCSGANAPSQAMRTQHWDRGLLSGVYAFGRPPRAVAPDVLKKRKKKQKARYGGGWGSKETPHVQEARAPPTPQSEPEPEPEELRAATYHPRDGYLVDGSKASGESLVWCFRRGQRLALVQGQMPHERVRATATVVRFARGVYHCVCDDGECLTLDPTGHRTRTVEVPLERRAVTGLHRTERVPAGAPAPAPDGAPLGFDVDDAREVSRVDPGSWAEARGVVHGWVLKSVDKTKIADQQAFLDAVITIARVRRKGSVHLEFEVPTFELCRPGVEYATGQRLTVLYRQKWRDAAVLRKPLEDLDTASAAADRNRARLRVFMTPQLVETCVLGLNHANHSLLFGEAVHNEDAYREWREERPEWGDMFDGLRKRCLDRERRGKKRESYHALVNGFSGKPRWALANYDGPKYQASSFASAAPRVYTWKRPPGWDYGVSSDVVASDGTAWAAVADLPTLVKVLLSRKGDDASRGAQAQCRVLLVNGPKEDTAALTQQRRALIDAKAEETRRSRATLSTPPPSSRNAFDETPPATPKAPTGDGNESMYSPEALQRRRDRADDLIEAIPLNLIGGVETKKLMAEMAVKQAVRQLCANWRKRSMAMYADVRTAKGQLRMLLMALSAQRQFGDPSTHLVPYLVKAGSLHRVARRVTTEGASVLEHYLDAAYGQSYRPRYRFLLQALHTNRLVLLIDATGDAKTPAMEAAAADAVVDAFLLERVALEVPRCVITGDLSSHTLDTLRNRFATLEVRQGLKSDHDDGLDCWYEAV